ncbi:RNA ligase family protein [Streptomyces sp. NPDC057217]|uniref:RNA ligase family protein n=1 Tax=Streptomyces sp. NPDC057217 TaxID=3346054 RepID=UPI0036377101
MPMQEKAPRPESLAGFEFTPWPKTARLFRDIVITEKLDGTNAAIHIGEDGRIAAQSRNRLITPEHDNYGFARWVQDNAADLAYILGPGLHFGEFWGQGIARKYGQDRKRFSLFNTERWFKTGDDGLDSMVTRAGDTLLGIDGIIGAVPVLYSGVFDETEIRQQLYYLQVGGSKAAPGFMNPEGICIFHTQTRQVMKVTLDANDAGKWEAVA